MLSDKRLRGNKAWWDTKKRVYPFHAIAPVSIKPHKVPGDHCSVALGQGIRTWGFKNEQDRQAFLDKYKEARAFEVSASVHELRSDAEANASDAASASHR